VDRIIGFFVVKDVPMLDVVVAFLSSSFSLRQPQEIEDVGGGGGEKENGKINHLRWAMSFSFLLFWRDKG